MARHALRITYDAATGAVACEHACTVQVAGHEVRAAEPVELAPDAAAWLAALVAENAAEMEARATRLAVQHAAAVSGKAQPGVKPLRIDRTVAPQGTASA